MPMVAGVQPNSLAQAAAATLKLVRSAHSSTLPAKKTTTVTVQLIGRDDDRSVLAVMAFLPGVAGVFAAGSKPRCSRRCHKHGTKPRHSPCVTASDIDCYSLIETMQAQVSC